MHHHPTTMACLSDDQLLAEVKRLATEERRATAALVRSLMEVDERRLYLREGCSSLFTWCTQVLGLEEGAAYNRIEVARAARRFPVILEALEDGSLTLTAVRLLAPHLTPQNHAEVLASAYRKTKREVELLVAALNPRPAAPVVVRRLPAPRAADPVVFGSSQPIETPDAPAAGTTSGMRDAAAAPQTLEIESVPLRPRAPQPAVAPLAPDRYRIQLTISADTHEKLRRALDLMRHAVPTGDVAAVFDRALTVLLDQLERQRFAATAAPRAGRGTRPGSRHISASVKREVWRRDGGQCAFIGTCGRCTERGFLEFHHLEPYAVGGPPTASNLELRCKAHNAYEAGLFFGGRAGDEVREPHAAYRVGGHAVPGHGTIDRLSGDPQCP